MTNSHSIQDVLFFPQMKPEKKKEVITPEQLVDPGVAADWAPVLIKMNINSIEDLKNANPNKLFNDLGGMRKKLKLEIAMPNLEDVKKWCE